MIFDSLVADFVGEICRWTSQQTLNCALSPQAARLGDDPAQVRKNRGCDHVKSLIQNFAGFTTGRRLKIGRTLNEEAPQPTAAATTHSG